MTQPYSAPARRSHGFRPEVPENGRHDTGSTRRSLALIVGFGAVFLVGTTRQREDERLR